MWYESHRSINRVSVYIFCLILLVGWAENAHAQPKVDKSIRSYLSGAAQSALFGPDPQLVRVGKATDAAHKAIQQTVGTNIQVNDPSAESCGTTGCTQSETSIAIDPTNSNNIAIGWNDGVGFFDPGVFDISGFGFSTDGGETWTDGGTPPNSSATIRISGDPAMAICGDGSVHFANLYIDTIGTFSGLAVSNGSFAGGPLVFDPAGPVIAVGNTSDFFDKEYLVCDPVTNTLYMSYTVFIGGGGNGQIEFINSTDGGAIWSSPIILQAEESTIVNQGSYPAAGPGGQVCVAWERDWRGAGPHIVVKCSTDYGQTFAVPWVRAGDIGSSSSNNPPNGYNRTRINDFPSIAIDTSGGPNNGNIYVAWHSTCEAMLGPFSGTTAAESEPNDTSGTADSMSIGDNYSGDISPDPDTDFIGFSAVAGQTIRAETILDTLVDSTLTLYDTDGSTILAFDDDSGDWWASKMEFTLPSTGTFFLAVASWSGVFSGTYTLELRDYSTCGPADPPGRETTIRDIIFTRSTDSGATFSPELIVNDDPYGADQWWPWVSVNSKGHVGIIWYDRRNNPFVNDLTDVFFALSNNGGVSFMPNVRITDTSTSWSGTGSDGVSPNFGDYINLTADRSDFYASWADGRLGDPDVFFAAMDIATINPVMPSTGGEDDDGSNCFIATAAYGSYMADEVVVLRQFRDKYLLTNDYGKAFVKVYYKYSPPIADVIKENGFLKTVTRVFLTPVVMGIAYPYQSLTISIALLFAAIALQVRRKKGLTA